MLLQTALVAVYPNSSLNAPSVAIAYLRQAACRCHFGGSSRSFAPRVALTVGMVLSRAFGRGKRGDSFGSFECHPVRIPSSARGHASGPYPPPCGKLALLLRLRRPYGLRFPASPDPPQMQSFGLGRRGHSLGFA